MSDDTPPTAQQMAEVRRVLEENPGEPPPPKRLAGESRRQYLARTKQEATTQDADRIARADAKRLRRALARSRRSATTKVRA